MPYSDLNKFWSDYMATVFASDGGGPDKIFRGVTDSNHRLIPSIGRQTREGTNNDVTTLERMLLDEFKRLSAPELVSTPGSDFDWLFLAQHYGLPTRLLDWSTNPLVALFFAAEKDDNRNGKVFCVRHAITDQYELFDYKTANYTDEHKREPVNLFALQPDQGTVIFVRPRYTDRRYYNQKSVFSCPRDPFSKFELEVEAMEFASHLKPAIRNRLQAMGISASFIYPGLGGIASEVKTRNFDPVTSGRLQMATFRAELKL